MFLYACVPVFCFLLVLFACFSWLLTLLIVVHQNDLIEYLNNILNTPENFHTSIHRLFSLTPLCHTVLLSLEFSKLLLYFHVMILYTLIFLFFKTLNFCNIHITFSTIMVLFIDIFPAISICTLVHRHKFVLHYLLSFECRKYAIFLCNDYYIMSFTSIFKI